MNSDRPRAAAETLAPAKVNLALHLLGRRPDGFHEIDSLVTFAEFGDRVGIAPSGRLSLRVSGPFGELIPDGGDNLVLRAAGLLHPHAGAALRLQKNIPVAAGLGGGSSDAAAALRLLSDHWQCPIPAADRLALLGADIPVCLAAASSHVQGIGERVSPVRNLPKLALVLGNPGIPLATAEVYRASGGTAQSPLPPLPRRMSAAELADWLKSQRNDLQAAAQRICPQIGEMLAVIGQCRNCLMARLSGSGASCFGIFTDAAAARAAASELHGKKTGWWAVATSG